MKKTPRLGSELKAARLEKGLSQQVVAERARLTQAHVSLIERGMDAHLSVLQKIAEAVGLQVGLLRAAPVRIPAPYGDDEIANRMYLLGRLAAARLSAENLSSFRLWIQRAVRQHGDRSYFRKWLAACEAGPQAMEDVLTDATEYGRYMRAVATMRPFVTKQERDAYYRPELPVQALML